MPAQTPRPLPASRLRRRVTASALRFHSTAALEPLAETLGQPRAADALALGLELDAAGYNLFVTGRPGSGREAMVRETLERLAPTRPRADDWVYVRDFVDADRATALRLPAGQGSELAHQVDEFIGAAARQIRAAFDSDQFAERRRAIESEGGARRDALVEEIRRYARDRGFGAEMTMTGIVTVPLIRGEPIDAEQFRRLSDRTRHLIEERGREIQAKIAETLADMRALEKDLMQRMRTLDREVAEFAAGPLAEELAAEFEAIPDVAAHLRSLLEEILGHLNDFRGDDGGETPSPIAALLGPGSNGHTDRYRVNVLVANGSVPGAPVVFERSPTYYNLAGRIDYRTAFGTMVTDFRQVKAGALHRANGGFLVLRAEEILRAPFAWDALKTALTSREIRIQNLASQYSAVPTATLQPQPIPLDVKVVIIGTPQLYSLLSAVDDDFGELFKVRVDFAPDMEWTDETAEGYARLISRLVRDSRLRHFNRSAVVRVIEHGARLEDDQRKLTARLGEISDLVTEASYWAGKSQRRLVTGADVDRAIERREFRSNMVEARMREIVSRGILRVDTSGERVGQVNGVAVIGVGGGHAFGHPCRISATTALGEGGVRSIERESDLSGKLHSKGVLILVGYLASTYAQDEPLTLAARIAFEQSYDEVDGDSASCAELCALVSALAGAGIRQGIAVTGSVDQHGAVQAVGGVTTKIEGFFDVCAGAGLTGDQGMIIPETNVETLMLKDAVIEAVRAGRFHIWPVRTVDQALAVITGRAPGRRRRDGSFTPGSLHEAAARRLGDYAAAARRFGAQAAPAFTDGRSNSRRCRERSGA